MIDDLITQFRTAFGGRELTQRDVVLWPPAAELHRVAAEQQWPRLRIRWSRLFHTWCWRVTGPGDEPLDDGLHDTWPEALAVGLAALEEASARWQA